MSMATFKKRPIPPGAVAQAEAAASLSPIVSDPRDTPPAAGVGSIQPGKPEVPPASDLGSIHPRKPEAPAADGLGSIQPVAQAPITARPSQTTKPGAAPAGDLGSIQDYRLLAVGAVVDVPLRRIKSNPVNPRFIYTLGAVDEMATSLKDKGQDVAALGYVDDGGEIVLIEGETRLRGSRTAGFTTLRVEIRDRPEDQRALYEKARRVNVNRREHTVLDDALRWRDLLDRKVYPSQSALAKALELGEDHVSRTLSLATLPMRIINVVSEHPELVTQRMLLAVRGYCEQEGEEATLELIPEILKKGMGYRDVEHRKEAAAKGPVPRGRPQKEAVTYGTGKGEIKNFEADGRIEFTMKGLSPDDAAKIVSHLKQLVQKKPA
jgi:ParB family chromosome partitioning protein